MRARRGCEAVRRLAETADVLIENYRPGVADKIGLGYDSLQAANPGLIYIALSAFGSNGPVVGGPGHRSGRAGDVGRDVGDRRAGRRPAARSGSRSRTTPAR